MKVLLCTTGYPPEHSGSGGRLHSMLERLNKRNPELEWSVITKRREPQQRPEGPTRIYALPPARRAFAPEPLGTMMDERWAARRHRPIAELLEWADLVHFAGWSWYMPSVANCAVRLRRPVIRELTTIGDPGARWPIWRRPAAAVNAKAAQLISISPALEAMARAAGATAPIWTRPNGVDPARFRLPDLDERRRRREEIAGLFPNAPSDAVFVVQVGRIRALKNQLLTLEAIARLSRRYHFLVIGPPFSKDDNYYRELRRRADEEDVSSRICVLGRTVSDVERYLKGADLLCHPSSAEGLGTAIVEALCCGLPVAASRLPGVTDWLIAPGRNGSLSELDHKNLARAIEAAADLSQQRAQIAAAARERFSVAEMDAGYEKIYLRLLRGP